MLCSQYDDNDEILVMGIPCRYDNSINDNNNVGNYNNDENHHHHRYQ